MLHAYLRAPRAAETLVVYIEGDGRAWESRSRPSPDPTPTDPVALRMAAQDTAPAVLYLARPCQYVRNEDSRGCASAYWTERRFAPEVLASLNLAVDRTVARLGASRVVLIGYSGGGTVAALLAERRADAAGLATVAGVLDHRAWTRHHGVSPLDGSDNPADHLDRLSRVAQWHFVGAGDPVVPPGLTEAVVERMGRPKTARVVRLDGFDHACCWDEAWPRLRRRLDRVVGP